MFGGRARADHIPHPGAARPLLRAGGDRPWREAAHHRDGGRVFRCEGGRDEAEPRNRRPGHHRAAPGESSGRRVAFRGRGPPAPVPDRRRRRRRQPAGEARRLHQAARRPGCLVRETPGANHPGQDAAGDRRPDRPGRAVVRQEGRPVFATGPGGGLQPHLGSRPDRTNAVGRRRDGARGAEGQGRPSAAPSTRSASPTRRR